MDDTISRAAAIDYLMTNMGWRDEDGYEVDDAEEKRAIITDLVNGIPAVDAIPVKWLRRWRDVTDIPLLAMNIDSILKVWEESNKYWGEVNKEQEAR